MVFQGQTGHCYVGKMNKRDVVISVEEKQTYLHLGIIAANTGYQGGLYKAKKKIFNESEGSGLDLIAWFAQQIGDEELEELYGFRNELLHGVVIVHPNGSIDIFDRQSRKQSYTSEEIRQYASRFYSLRFENRVTMTSSTISGDAQDENLRSHENGGRD